MNTNEGLDLRVPDADRRPDAAARQRAQDQRDLVHGGRRAGPARRWHFQNTAQVMRTRRSGTRYCRSTPSRPPTSSRRPPAQGGLGFPAGSTGQYLLHQRARRHRQPDAIQYGQRPRRARRRVAREQTAQGRAGPAPAPAAVRTALARLGGYVANYTQDNHWFFTDILTDVRDNPHFLDLIVTPAGGGTPDTVTKNGFRQLPAQLRERAGRNRGRVGHHRCRDAAHHRLRADLGARVEYDNFVQSSENTSQVRPRRRSGDDLRQ